MKKSFHYILCIQKRKISKSLIFHTAYVAEIRKHNHYWVKRHRRIQKHVGGPIFGSIGLHRKLFHLKKDPTQLQHLPALFFFPLQVWVGQPVYSYPHLQWHHKLHKH